MRNLLKNLPVLLLPVLLFTAAFTCKAQLSTTDKKAEAFYQEALTGYIKKDYATAEKNIVKAVERDPNFKEAFTLYGDILADQLKYEQAIDIYLKAYGLDPRYARKALFFAAELERALGRFDSAKKHYEEYLGLVTDPKDISMVRLSIERAVVADALLKNPRPFDPKNLGPEINTPNGEYGPTLKADQQTLIFTRREKHDYVSCPTPNGQTEDFYMSVKRNNQWVLAQNMGTPLNTNCNEGAQCLSADGQLLFFAAAGRTENGRMFETSDIYWSRKVGDSFTPSRNMGQPVNSGAWESQPSISVDGRTLYFVSTRPGGFGGADIYYTQLQNDGTWAKPVNLGPEINTPGDEFSPFIHTDDQTLYFSSDYLPGLGGFDLFYTRKGPKGEFLKPTNLGSPINTKNDEYSLVVSTDGKTAYYASNALDGGFGDYDLYSFELYEEARPQLVTYMKGRVADAVSKKMLDAQFELIDLKTGDVVVKSISDKVTGEFLVCIPANRDYALNVSKNGYLFHSENFSLKEAKTANEPFLKNVELTPIQKDVPVVLRNIFFETGSAELKPESRVELDKLVEMLVKNPSMKIELSGHTDNVGSKESNLKLSDNRAKSVSTYLSGKGIAADRLSTQGYGDSKPIDDNNTEQGRANNRRTEFKVTQI